MATAKKTPRKPRKPSPDFTKPVVLKLGQRAAYRCSNPDCDATTSGPNPDEMKATIVGEGAHIYGARKGQARYRDEMTDLARGSISNGIWLCVGCHTTIDKAESSYPPDLLFHWRNTHEAKITAERGKPRELILLRAQNRDMEDFSDVSLFAQQIIKDKPPGWEYQLTAESLDNLFSPVYRRWKDLLAGSYTKNVTQRPAATYMNWIGGQISFLTDVSTTLGELINVRMKQAWGADGVPGDAHEIVHVCRMITRRANDILAWDEVMRFTKTPAGFEGLPLHLSKGAAVIMNDIPEIMSFLRSIFQEGKAVPGTYNRTITFTLPDDFESGLQEQLAICEHAVVARGYQW